MKILVAGGAGYLGAVLVPKLLERGYDVDVVDLFWFGNNLPLEVRKIHKDIFDLTVRDLKSYDQVVFLAGLSNDPMAEFSPGKNFVFNAAAPAYLAYTCKKAGVKRYVYASSCSVYGFTDNELYDENAPVLSQYPYGISKYQGEAAVMQLADDEFSVIALRKGTISGYSPRMRFDLIVNTMFMTAMKDGAITINNPSIWRPILGVSDAANAYVRAIEASAKISGVFNIASTNHTVGEVADLVRETIETQLSIPVRLIIRHVQDGRNYKVNIERAKSILSFHPYQDVPSIVKTLVDHLGSISDWDNPIYYNIRTLKAIEGMPEPQTELRALSANA
jgi:nucleoside-diphosphate-sugar epimerase